MAIEDLPLSIGSDALLCTMRGEGPRYCSTMVHLPGHRCRRQFREACEDIIRNWGSNCRG